MLNEIKKMKQFSFQKRIQSFKFAFRGIFIVLKTQHNAWIHIVVAVAAAMAGIFCQLNLYEWCLLFFAIGLVFIAEICNTAIEFLVNYVSPEQNEKAGIIKDIAAAGVLVAAIVSVIIGCFIFLPKMNLF